MTRYSLLILDNQDYEIPDCSSGVSREQDDEFWLLSRLDKTRVMLQMPLPQFTFVDSTTSSAADQGSGRFGIVNFKTSNGVIFSIVRHYYNSCLHFNSTFKEEFTRDEFESRFISPFLAQFSEKFSDHQGLEFLQNKGTVTVESTLQTFLHDCLFSIIKKPIMHALDENKNLLLHDFPEFIIAKGHDVSVEERLDLDFRPTFTDNSSSSTLFLGLAATPDFCIGHSVEFIGEIPMVSFSVIGEIKLPTLKMKQVYDCIMANREEDLNQTLVNQKLLANSDLLRRCLQKLITTSINAGCQRLILTNGCHFLLIEIDANFVKELSSDPLVGIIKSKHCLLDSQDPYIRLKIASFMYFSGTLALEQKKLQSNISKELKKQLEKYRKLSQSRPSTSSSNASTSFVGIQRKRTRALDSAISSQLSSQDDPNVELNEHYWFKRSHDVSIPYTCNDFNEQTLAEYYEIELGDMVKSHVNFGVGYNSQVFLVDTLKFTKDIALRDYDTTAIVKVFDVFWRIGREMTHQEFQKQYQVSVNMAEMEVKSYIKLKSLQGSVIPKLFGYGTLDDIEPSVGKIYIRVFGPFVCIENIERGDFQVTKEFLENKIIPQFRKIHSFGILHNDIRVENIIITKDGNVKIIDFAFSKFTTDRKLFEEEICNLYMCFQIPSP